MNYWIEIIARVLAELIKATPQIIRELRKPKGPKASDPSPTRKIASPAFKKRASKKRSKICVSSALKALEVVRVEKTEKTP
jgi:hypothetical protein